MTPTQPSWNSNTTGERLFIQTAETKDVWQLYKLNGGLYNFLTKLVRFIWTHSPSAHTHTHTMTDTSPNKRIVLLFGEVYVTAHARVICPRCTDYLLYLCISPQFNKCVSGRQDISRPPRPTPFILSHKHTRLTVQQPTSTKLGKSNNPNCRKSYTPRR